MHVKSIIKQLYYLMHVFQYDEPPLLFLVSGAHTLCMHIKHLVCVMYMHVFPNALHECFLS